MSINEFLTGNTYFHLVSETVFIIVMQTTLVVVVVVVVVKFIPIFSFRVPSEED